MLSSEEKKEIEDELAVYPARRHAVIDALKVVQRHRGWVSDEALRDVAGFLEMTVDEVDSVATFYNLIFRKEVGRHKILLCDSVSCWIMRYERIYGHLKERLGIGFGETTGDGRFTLLPIQCLGACDRAPACIVDEDLHTDLTPEKVDEILQHYD